jgi:hypothetical protein
MKKIITNYAFNKTAKTVTFNGMPSISLAQILLITNVTDGIIIYNFADPLKGGTVATNVLTLAYNTTAMDDTDKLQIFYDDAPDDVKTVPFSTSVAGVQDLAITDCAGYAWVTVIFTSLGTGASLAGQFAIDGVAGAGTVFQSPNSWYTWSAATNSPSGGPTLSTSNFSESPVLGDTFKLRVTALTSGTLSGVLKFHRSPRATRMMGASVISPVAAGGNITNGFPIGGLNSGNQLDYIRVANGRTDGQTLQGILEAVAMLYNGTTMDYPRSPGAATGTTGTGITAAGSMGLGKTTNPTAVTDGQFVTHLTDKLGKQVVVGSIRDLKGDQSTTITSSTTETTIVAAGGASVFRDLYGLIITNTSATATEVIIRDVTAGGTARSFMVPAGDTRGFMLNESAALKQGTANSAWTATCGTSVASVKIDAMYVANL